MINPDSAGVLVDECKCWARDFIDVSHTKSVRESLREYRLAGT